MSTEATRKIFSSDPWEIQVPWYLKYEKIQIYSQAVGSQKENMHHWLINTGWIANSGILKEYNLNLL